MTNSNTAITALRPCECELSDEEFLTIERGPFFFKVPPMSYCELCKLILSSKHGHYHCGICSYISQVG